MLRSVGFTNQEKIFELVLVNNFRSLRQVFRVFLGFSTHVRSFRRRRR